MREEINFWQRLRTEIDELAELEVLARQEGDESLRADIEASSASLAAEFERRRISILFGGPYDEHDAIIAVSAGAGGTEASDWTAMLLRMYLRWAERHGFSAEVIDQLPSDSAGIKSATVIVAGVRAYGWLRAEAGVHRLVRVSPFDSQSRRHTSFAQVEVLPRFDEAAEMGDIPADELRIDTFRSQGAGGQSVNTTDSAVRITHLPTGIAAQSQNERSQHQNRAVAMAVLRGRLLAHQQDQRSHELASLKGEHVEAGWGRQIRSYTLQPFQLVKDHRTGIETSSTNSVLDGDLDDFIIAELERNSATESD